MTLAVLLTGSSQCHSLIQGHIIADNGSLTNDDTVTVIDENPLPICAPGWISMPVLRTPRWEIYLAQK